MVTTATLMASDLDPFSDEALPDPWEIYRELRNLGPVVHLPQYGLWAVMRYADVRAILGDWETFSSMAVGLNPVFNAIASSNMSANILMSSPPTHHRLRAALGEDLAPRGLSEKLEGFVTERAETLVEGLVKRGSFDAVRDLARPFVMNLVYDLNGLPEGGRDRFFDWASASFDALGPTNERSEKGLAKFSESLEWLASEAGRRDQVRPGSWADTVYEAVERGDFPGAGAYELLSTYITPALDTTIHSLGWAIKLFAEHPDQWTELRENPELMPGAYREVLRLQPSVHHFGRLVEKDAEIDGVPVSKGTHLMVSFASGNRDERFWTQADEFDIHRSNNGRHLAFGYGIHACVGQGLARLEGHSILAAFASRVERFEVGDSTPFLNNVAHGLDTLPVTVFEATT